jgi:sulfoxide reductase heme-binding subunit YedZ
VAWSRKRRAALIQTTAIVIGFAPLAGLAVAALGDRLGANPIEAITHETGEWALRWLLVCLAVTPARRFLGWTWAAPLRRTFGLIAFSYATAHLSTWVVLDWFFDLEAMLEDVVERRYIAAGMAAYLTLVPLAATSTRGMIRRLGRRWLTLHKLVYVAAVLAIVHFVWLVKADLLEPLLYAGVLAALLALRIPRSGRAAAATDGR